MDNIGMDINDKVRAELGEIKEQLIYDLDKNSIEYKIHFDKVNKHNIRETVISISSLGIELYIENDIINYIKSDNNAYSNIFKIDSDREITDTVNEIKNAISERFEGYKVKIERIDIVNMNVVVVVSSDKKARLTLHKDNNNNIYINTIREI